MKVAAVFMAAALLAPGASSARGADPLSHYDNHDTKGSTPVAGPTYLNNNYGYEVRIPHGQIGWMDTPPSPNHGINVYLGNRRSIEVDASFDSADLGSTDAVSHNVAEFVPGAEELTAPELLGNRRAERIVQSWRGSDRRRIVVARWDDAGGAGDAINFVLTLETTAASFEQDRRIFNDLVRSFRYTARRS